MSLRTKFLVLFLALGVVPLLALGILSYVWGTHALEDLLAERTAAIASRAAETLTQRYTRALSDLLFLAQNAETQWLLGNRQLSGVLALEEATPLSAHESYDMTGPALSEALAFLDSAWRTVGTYWRWAEIRDADGTVTHRMGEPLAEPEALEAPGPSSGRIEYIVSRPIRTADREPSAAIGSIRGSLLLEEILPRGELAGGFGESGYSVVFDRDGGRILFHPGMTARRGSISSLLGPGGWNVDPDLLVDPRGRFSYSKEGTARVASFVSLDDPPWTIVSSESLEEFSAPFARMGSLSLLVVLLVTATVSVAFVFVTRRATASLRHLTAAADEVAAGNLDPSLPPGGGDEVGRLSGAFSIMVDQVRAMIRSVEESRHMSAIGEFAAQLSHEIRNPLTSIKLNLQRLERGVRDGRIPSDYAKAVDLSLREAKRLDGTVRGVLSISRTRAPRRDPLSLHDVLRSALEALAPQLEEEGAAVETVFSARNDTLLGDRELLKGAFLNLFLNSVEVMEPGGVLRVRTESVPATRCIPVEERGGSGLARVRTEAAPAEARPGPAAARAQTEGILVRISDDGPGVPEEIRDRIFDPFFTTKEGGSGFGLPLAVRVMEEHAGILTLAEPDPSGRGATFLVVLPVTGSEKEDP
jgi:signal transduction histidine kinase